MRMNKMGLEDTQEPIVHIANILKGTRSVVSRLPRAVGESMVESIRTFVSSTCVLVPVGLVMNANNIRHFKVWMSKGASTGIEWAKISTIFTGTEVFVGRLRNVDDRINAYIGSGTTSAVLRVKDGRLAMVQGFVVGYVFMAVIDTFLSDLPDATPPTTASTGKRGATTATGSRVPTPNKGLNPSRTRSSVQRRSYAGRESPRTTPLVQLKPFNEWW